jgi:hypothetical protein
MWEMGGGGEVEKTKGRLKYKRGRWADNQSELQVTIPLKIRTLRCWISCEISFQGGSSNYRAFIRPFYRFSIRASQPIYSISPNASTSPNIPSCVAPVPYASLVIRREFPVTRRRHVT